jgi:hypothetical protein
MLNLIDRNRVSYALYGNVKGKPLDLSADMYASHLLYNDSAVHVINKKHAELIPTLKEAIKNNLVAK